MLFAEYDYNEDIAVKQAEAYEEGVANGLEEGIETSIRRLMNNMNISQDKAMDYLGIPEEDRDKYMEKV